MKDKPENAEIIALRALEWLAGNDELFPVFLGATGAAVNDLATSARDLAFLASVLDFLVMDDAWVIAFCESAGLAYEVPMQARAGLPGGANMHWT
tara:strand:- start:715 stop:999 length:285 start_codon:yes stop_codon:yes gene_type:complete